MSKIVILGSGAAPGVPAVACGWGNCNPNNPKNRRRRTGTYIEIGKVCLLIDTSPDLRSQLLDNNIRRLDAVLYTHTHADHLHGIDDLRELNRISRSSLDIWGDKTTRETISLRFPYLLADEQHPNNVITRPSLIMHCFEPGHPFKVAGVDIMPLRLEGHHIPSSGYLINQGEILYIADCKEISPESLALIKKPPRLMIAPLTSDVPQPQHMGLDKLLEYVNILKPQLTVINHMAAENDYDVVNSLTPDNVMASYDNMVLEI